MWSAPPSSSQPGELPTRPEARSPRADGQGAVEREPTATGGDATADPAAAARGAGPEPTATGDDTGIEPTAGGWPTTLGVRAGNTELALAFDVTAEQLDVTHVARVPGAAAWCLGLVQHEGRLITVLDAGRLFGDRPSKPRSLVRLRGVPVETALAVDEITGMYADDAAVPLRFDRRALAEHPALQPGAANAGARPAARTGARGPGAGRPAADGVGDAGAGAHRPEAAP